MTSSDDASVDNNDFLAKCEEQLKDRFTDKDEEFMKIFKLEPSIPPIVESWWIPSNTNRRNLRRNNKHRDERYGSNRDDRYGGDRDNRYGGDRDNRYGGDRDNYDRRDNRGNRGNYERRGYNDYQDRGHQGYGNHRSRY